MANRFWVGGDGDWGSTSHWASSSGGAGGQTVPTNSDDVFFDNNSFAGNDNLTIINQILSLGQHQLRECRNISFAKSTAGVIFLQIWGNDFDIKFQIYGNIASDGNVSINGALNQSLYGVNLVGTSGSATIDMQGAYLRLRVLFSNGIASTRTWTLSSNLNMSSGEIGAGETSGKLEFSDGTTLDFNGYDVTAAFIDVGSNLIMGAGTIRVRDFYVGLSATMNTGTARLYIADMTLAPALVAGDSASEVFQTDGFVIPEVHILGPMTMTYPFATVGFQAGSLYIETTGIVDFNNKTIATTDFFSIGSGRTSRRNVQNGTIDVLGTYTLRYTKFTNITAAGVSLSWHGIGLVNGGGNSSIYFASDGTLPSFNTGLLSAIARTQQGLTYASFIVGGKDSAGNFALFKRSIFSEESQYFFSLFRDAPRRYNNPFTVMETRFNIAIPLDEFMEIIPVLHFDGDTRQVAGTPINLNNYEEGQMFFKIGPANFAYGTRGQSDYFLEFIVTSMSLSPIKLPFYTDVDVDEDP